MAVIVAEGTIVRSLICDGLIGPPAPSITARAFAGGLRQVERCAHAAFEFLQECRARTAE